MDQERKTTQTNPNLAKLLRILKHPKAFNQSNTVRAINKGNIS
jgi:hypothetical protein